MELTYHRVNPRNGPVWGGDRDDGPSEQQKSDESEEFSMSKYWRLVGPLLWDVKELAQGIKNLCAKKFPDRDVRSIRILDASCGSGELGYEMAKLGLSVELNDCDEAMIRYAKKCGEQERYKTAAATNVRRTMCYPWSQLVAEVVKDEDNNEMKYDVIFVRADSTPYY